MTLYKFSLEMFDKISEAEKSNQTEEQGQWKSDLLHSALDSALAGAAIVRNYREMYGLRTVSPFLIQNAAHALQIFLPNMGSCKTTLAPNSSAQAIQDGFTECFRCLVAMGMGLLLPRGIARMIYHTSRVLNVQLPDEVMSMLSLVAETAWQPSDLHQLNSCYPNWALASAEKAEVVNYQMDDMLRKWEDLGVHDQALSTENETEVGVPEVSVAA